MSEESEESEESDNNSEVIEAQTKVAKLVGLHNKLVHLHNEGDSKAVQVLLNEIISIGSIDEKFFFDTDSESESEESESESEESDEEDSVDSAVEAVICALNHMPLPSSNEGGEGGAAEKDVLQELD